MRRNWQFGLVGVLTLLLATAAVAIEPPQGGGVAAKGYGAPGLFITNAHQPLSRLTPDLAQRLVPQLVALGVPTTAGFYDLRTGRWGTLVMATPLAAGVPSDSATYKNAVWQAFKTFVAANGSSLGVDTAQFSAPSIGSYENGRVVHIYADQTVNGITVRGSYITGTVNSGNLIIFGAQNWGTVNVSTTPSVSSEAAKRVVVTHLSGFTVQAWGKPELVIVPLASGDATPANLGRGLTHRLAWSIKPAVAGSDGSWEALVDAHQGELLAFYDRNLYFDQRRVVGGVFPVSNDGQSPNGIPDGVEQPGYPMSRAYVTDSNGTRLTANTEGLVQAIGVIRTDLTGPFLRIIDNCGAIDESSPCPTLDLRTSGGTDCATPPGASPGNTHSARTGFFEVNRLIDQAKTWMGPASVAHLWMNRQLPAKMNVDNSCNAFFSPADTTAPDTGSINFYRQFSSSANSGRCRNTGEIAGVFDHEWGHGLDTFDDSPGVSLPGEAYADMVAMMRIGVSCLGRGFFATGTCGGNGDPCVDCTGVREADWMKRASGKPHDLAWVLGQNPTIPGNCGAVLAPPTPFNAGPCARGTHCEGSIITEAMWDLLKRDLPCQGKRWEKSPGGTIAGGRCSDGQARAMDDRSAHVIATRLFYIAGGGVKSGYQCDTAVAGCVASSWYLQMLAADDDNGTLFDGTPHMVAINDAFVRHGIGCGVPLALNGGCAATPAPGTAPVVTASAGVNSATIQWTAVPGAAEYWVLRTDGVYGCDFGKTRVATVPASAPRTLTQTGLLDGHTYYYSVVAVSGVADLAISSCSGPMSDCAAVTPAAAATSTAPGAAVQQSGGPVMQDGDGDPFVDNCETADMTFNVVNTGGTPLTNVRVTSIVPSVSQTTVVTSLPIAVGALAAGCGDASGITTRPATFRFKAAGLPSQSTLTFTVTVEADGLPAPVTGTLTVEDTETDLLLTNLAYDFENGTQGWTVVSGSFTRTNLPAGAEGTAYHMTSSKAVDNACDRIRSPKFRLTPETTLSLYNQFATEPETPATPFYDRANVGLVDAAGKTAIVQPDGGRLYNTNIDYTGCNNGPGWASDIPEAPINLYALSTWSPAALNAATRANEEVQVEVTNGTDAHSSAEGLQFDQVRLTNILVKIADASSDSCPAPDLRVTNIRAVSSKTSGITQGDRVTILATVTNSGNREAAASTTRFDLDGAPYASLATGALAPGASVDLSVSWDTKQVKGQHVWAVTADAASVVEESSEGNNRSTLTVDVRGNKVSNSSFEEPNASGTGPAGWTGNSTGAGTTSWSDGGSDGSKSASASGNGGNALTSGSPSWTSDPVAVTPGEVLTLAVSVSSSGASSAASAGLVYLSVGGQVLDTVTVLTAPLMTSGFATLQQLVTIPPGVTHVRVKLAGFAPADLRTAGTIRFDEVGLFGN